MLQFILPFVFSAQIHAQLQVPGVVVEAKRIDDALAEPGPSTTVLEKEQIERSATVGEVLRDQPGVRLVESGPAGQPASIFIRGAPSEQTLVLLDGIEINDPTSTSRGFDFANLSTENIDRIEIFRGPESFRFGPSAAGGVINIVSRKGKGPGRLHYLGEGGSFETARASVGASGARENFYYSAFLGQLKTQGFSAARGGSEADGTQRSSLLLRLGSELSPTSNVDFTYRTLFTYTDLDFGGGPAGDDPNYRSAQREHSAGAVYQGRSFDGHLRSGVHFTYSNLKRDYDNDPDPLHSDDFHERFQGEILGAETRHEYTFNSIHALEGVLSLRRESAGSQQLFNGTASSLARHQNSQLGKALIHKALFKNFRWLAGLRHDGTEHAGEALTYSVAPQYVSGGFSARLSYSTGFRAPSLYQLYSSFGSRNLNPETTTAFEASIEYVASSPWQMAITYFGNRYTNLIDFDPAQSKYGNIAAANARGVETQFSADVAVWFRLEATHTYLEAKDARTQLRLLRRPAHSSAVKLIWSSGPARAAIGWRAVGAREDTDPATFTRTHLNSYGVASLESSYEFTPALKIYARTENLFNQRYEDVAGYGTPGLSGYAGVSGQF